MNRPPGISNATWTSLLLTSLDDAYVDAAVSLIRNGRSPADALAEVLLAATRDLKTAQDLAIKLSERTTFAIAARKELGTCPSTNSRS